ncbi:hypothetical protein ACFP2T_01945 [Plantactinospora solaniradicis]|uniref:Uncharacterized protein n=1 Tax=Plantactinospora solaniradicis TaxID=1723736 RepID=A0ABW1K221_9ACTN
MSGDEPEDLGESALERRYRWLLAWYPWEHRRTYEDEMLGALLTDARPGQRWPAPGDTANLVFAAVRARFGLTVRQVVDRSWVDASAVFGLLAALLLLAWQVAPILVQAAWAAGFPELGISDWYAHPTQWVRLGLWCVVVTAVLVGFPRWAASAAWVAVLADAVVLGSLYGTESVAVANMLWPAALGIVCAVALTVPAPRGRALEILGRARFLFIAGCSVLFPIAMAWRVYRRFEETVYLLVGFSTLLLYLTAAAGLLAAALGVPAPIRRRGFVLLGPVVAVYFVVRVGLAGWMYSNGHMGHPVYLVPIQWTLLVVVPLLTFALGLVVVRWREQTLRLVALGRDIDRHRPDPPAPAR